MFFFFNDTATTEIYTLSLHDALPISRIAAGGCPPQGGRTGRCALPAAMALCDSSGTGASRCQDRKSTRLNSSHANISYAVFCLKKKKNINHIPYTYATSIKHSNLLVL